MNSEIKGQIEDLFRSSKSHLGSRHVPVAEIIDEFEKLEAQYIERCKQLLELEGKLSSLRDEYPPEMLRAKLKEVFGAEIPEDDE